MCIEGFQVLQYSPNLLPLLFHIISEFGSSELSAHRLSVCKFLYRAASFLTYQPAPELDLKQLAVRVLRGAALSATTLRDLQDVQCLLLEIGVTSQKQELSGSKGKPWSGVVDDLLEVKSRLLAFMITHVCMDNELS